MSTDKEHAALLSLLDKHLPITCGACGKEVRAALRKLDQTGTPLDAAVYACESGNCEWKRTVRLVLAEVNR